MIKGITVTLINLVEDGVDAFNNPTYTETETSVDNVLVAPSTADDVTTSVALYGRMARYTIAIPKGDTHTWENQKVVFFGETWRIIGLAMQGIEDNIPLSWNAKWYVERYE